jgi:NAD(P)-dependent dehydrogenase (short-subunit alcohol dehydrogenase family)
VHVLVTGCSSGIGAATAAELLRRGHSVTAAVRKEADAEALLERHPTGLDVVRFDVTDDDAVAREVGRVAERPLDAVVNNAGAAFAAPLEHLPLALLREQLDINVVGQLAVTQAALPALRRSSEGGSGGRVVVVGSIGGRVAGGLLGPYHASKFAVVGLTDSLRAELAPWGIPVILIEPGVIASPIWATGEDRGRRLFDALPEAARARYRRQMDAKVAEGRRNAQGGAPPQTVAEVIAGALEAAKPRPRYLVGRDARLAGALAKLPPRLLYRLTASREGD